MPADPQQLTPWFDGSVKPAREGVYMRRIVHRLSDGRVMRSKRVERVFWDLRHKLWFGYLNNGRLFRSLFQSHNGNANKFEWRGLTKEQK